MKQNTAKNFVLQLGSLASLYLSVAFFLVLVFGYINIRFPDSLDSVWQLESAASSIRLGFAMVLVFFPTYLYLTRVVNKNRRNSTDHMYLGLTKWLIYLSLLVGGAVLLGDLVAVIMGFLEGDLTQRFMFKVFAVFAVTGAAFYYYIKDAQGYWIKNEKTSVAYGAGAVVIVAAMLATSLSYIETPAEVRESKTDTQMVSDLQDMQWRIEAFHRTEDALPESLAQLFGEFAVPTPPEGRPAYTYTVESETEYSLCAEFLNDSAAMYDSRAMPIMEKNYNWEHKAGTWCFEREIDDLYRQ